MMQLSILQDHQRSHTCLVEAEHLTSCMGLIMCAITCDMGSVGVQWYNRLRHSVVHVKQTCYEPTVCMCCACVVQWLSNTHQHRCPMQALLSSTLMALSVHPPPSPPSQLTLQQTCTLPEVGHKDKGGSSTVGQEHAGFWAWLFDGSKCTNLLRR